VPTEGEHASGIEALEAALARAQTASVAKDEFLSMMSHELRDPLNAVLGFAQLLVRDALSARTRAHAEHILVCGEHLLHLVEDIQDLARIEAGAIRLASEPVAVGSVVNEVLEMLAEPAAHADVRVEVASPLAAMPVVVVDRARYVQILLNLGSNAVKYNHRGGTVTFAVSTPKEQTSRVCVTDTGVGIPVDRHARLFRPFERAGQEIGAIPGTGLGLTIAKRLAELMHGTIGFNSVPSQGSAFWVDAPRCVPL
jgi:signal transduction histidine kinase